MHSLCIVCLWNSPLCRKNFLNALSSSHSSLRVTMLCEKPRGNGYSCEYIYYIYIYTYDIVRRGMHESDVWPCYHRLCVLDWSSSRPSVRSIDDLPASRRTGGAQTKSTKRRSAGANSSSLTGALEHGQSIATAKVLHPERAARDPFRFRLPAGGTVGGSAPFLGWPGAEPTGKGWMESSQRADLRGPNAEGDSWPRLTLWAARLPTPQETRATEAS